MPERKNGLNDRQLAAIEMLLQGKPFSEVAASMGIDPKTLYRWRQDEIFREALNARRQEAWGGVIERLKDLVHPSLEVMAQHLADPYDRARFRAASAVLRLVNLKDDRVTR
jgi:transposase-like protein